MLFSNLLYIFQSEHYDRMRFIKFVYANIVSWNSFADRGKIDWTLRAKILMFLSLFLLLIDFAGAIFFFPENFWILAGIFLLEILAFPLYLVLADFLLTPVLAYKKKKIFAQAEKILEHLKSNTATGSSSLQVIGITGSFGKTSLKNILTKILETQFAVMTIPGNINTDLGVANYLIAHESDLKNIDFLVVEMGAFTTGDIQSICDVVHPEYSFLTAIAPVHLERFGSIENTAKAKFELPNATSKTAYVNGKNTNIQKFFPENFTKNSAETYFMSSNETLFTGVCNTPLQDKSGDSRNPEITNVAFLPEFSGISFVYKNQEFSTKLISDYIFEFFELIFPFAEEIGISLENLQKGISHIDYTPHRLEVIKNAQTGVTVIDDSYNGNFSGFISGITALSRASGRKIILTPGIVELGDLQEKTHQDLAKMYIESVDFLLLVENSNTKIIQKVLDAENFLEYKMYTDVHKAHADLPNMLRKGDTILFQNDLSDNYR